MTKTEINRSIHPRRSSDSLRTEMNLVEEVVGWYGFSKRNLSIDESSIFLTDQPQSRDGDPEDLCFPLVKQRVYSDREGNMIVANHRMEDSTQITPPDLKGYLGDFHISYICVRDKSRMIFEDLCMAIGDELDYSQNDGILARLRRRLRR